MIELCTKEFFTWCIAKLMLAVLILSLGYSIIASLQKLQFLFENIRWIDKIYAIFKTYAHTALTIHIIQHSG